MKLVNNCCLITIHEFKLQRSQKSKTALSMKKQKQFIV